MPDKDEIDDHARDTVRSFLDRAESVLACSIAQRADLDKLGVSWNIRMEKTPQGLRATDISRTLPDEEQIEAAAARVRPLVLESEPINYNKVMKALRRLTMNASETDRQLIRELSASWRTVPKASRWTISVANTQTGQEWPPMDDRQIAMCWLYGDLIHADEDKRAAVAHLGRDERLQAGLALVRDVIVHVKHTVRTIRDLEARGVISLR